MCAYRACHEKSTAHVEITATHSHGKNAEWYIGINSIKTIAQRRPATAVPLSHIVRARTADVAENSSDIKIASADDHCTDGPTRTAQAKPMVPLVIAWVHQRVGWPRVSICRCLYKARFATGTCRHLPS